MEYFYFYFENNERVYNLKLTGAQEKESIRILQTQKDGGAQLMQLKLDKLKLISCYGTDNDVKDLYIALFEDEGNKLTIHLSQKKSEEELPKDAKRGNFRIIKEKDELEIRSLGNNQVETFDIHIVYEDEEIVYGADIIINCIPDEQIYDVVLDFGSEACQMYVEEESALFNNCAENFYNINAADIKARTYHQQEDSGNQDYEGKLFRSIFFLAKEVKRDNVPVLQKPGKNDPLLCFITRRDNSDQKGERLPNIKISYLSGQTFYQNIDLKMLHQAIIMRFVHEAVMEVKKKAELKNPSLPCAIRITILVPNVMNQDQVLDLIEDIRKHTNSGEFKELLPENMRDSIFDVRSYSESDASFAYWFKQINKDPLEPGNYLMIDVGKGTTDISIIKIENASEAVSVYRSGFVGAGNALTYAFFENQIVSMAGGKHGRKFIQKVLSQAEPAKLYELENIIEEFKRNPEEYPPQSSIELKDDMGPDAIIDCIKKIGCQPDNRGIILSTIHNIIEKIVVNVEERDFRKVILSGRAFKYPEFLEETQKILRRYYDLEEDPIYIREKAKNGCLQGPLMRLYFNMSSDMIAVPKKVDVEERGNREELLKKDFDIIVKELQREKKDYDAEKKDDENVVERIWSNTKMSIARSRYSFLNALRNLNNEAGFNNGEGAINVDATNDDIVKIMLGEKKIQRCDNNTRFYIADDIYEGDESYENEDYLLFFNGKDFYVRGKNRNIKLIPAKERITADMLYESLFPYSHKVLGNNYMVPEITARKI